jgi:DNA-binding transcriptional regulator YiaG
MWPPDQSPVRVKRLRTGLGKTQEEFAEFIGTSVATVREWEQGRGPVPLLAQKFLTRLEQDLRREPAAVSA